MLATSEFLRAGRDIPIGANQTIKDEIVARIPPGLQALREWPVNARLSQAEARHAYARFRA
jgi:hypothetical protein